MINSIRFPKWAEVKTLDKDEFYYPTTARKARTITEARAVYSAFLSQVHTHPNSVNYYGWLNQIAVEGLVLEAYEASYDIANILEKLPADTVVSTKVSHDKMRTHTAGDYKLEFLMKCIKAIALYHMGEKEEALNLSKQIIDQDDYIETKFLHSIAYNFYDFGDSENADKVYEYFADINVKKGKMKSASSTMESCSYFYAKQEYDKVIKLADVYLKLGSDPKPAAEILYKRLGATPYFVEHWNATYRGLNRYKDFALKAKQGKFIDMNNLKDGIYTGVHTSFKGADFTSTVTIENGKISSIVATQSTEDAKRQDDRPFASAEIIPQRMLKAGSFFVDSVASAAISSNSIKLSVMEALLKATKA